MILPLTRLSSINGQLTASRKHNTQSTTTNKILVALPVSFAYYFCAWQSGVVFENSKVHASNPHFSGIQVVWQFTILPHFTVRRLLLFPLKQDCRVTSHEDLKILLGHSPCKCKKEFGWRLSWTTATHATRANQEINKRLLFIAYQPPFCFAVISRFRGGTSHNVLGKYFEISRAPTNVHRRPYH